MATYFVKNGGSDGLDGLLDGNAWATIAKVNGFAFSAGDVVQFKAGSIWREQLTVPSSGVSGNPIVFQSYGVGANPIIAGSDLLTSWIVEGSNYYSASLSVKPGSVIVDVASRLTPNLVSKASLVPGQWFWEVGTTRVYVRLIADSPPAGHVVEGTERSNAILNSKSWVSFSNIDTYGTTNVAVFENGSSHTVFTSVSGNWSDVNGFLVRAGFDTFTSVTASNNLFYGISIDGDNGGNNCTLNNTLTQFNGKHGIALQETNHVTINGGDSSFNGSVTVEGNGIDLNSIGGLNSSVIRVNNFNSHDNMGNGWSSTGDNTPTFGTDIIINGGLWYNNNSGPVPCTGIRLDTRTNLAIVKYALCYNNGSGGIVVEDLANNCTIMYNIVYGNTNGLTQSNGTGTGVVWYGNVSFSNTSMGFAHVSSSASAIVKNNIFVNNTTDGYMTDGTGTPDVVDYNLVFGNGVNYSGITAPTHDINSDPLFVNSSLFDFRLKAGSPALAGGINLGGPYNIGLDNRTPLPAIVVLDQNMHPTAWTIGAYVAFTGASQIVDGFVSMDY